MNPYIYQGDSEFRSECESYQVDDQLLAADLYEERELLMAKEAIEDLLVKADAWLTQTRLLLHKNNLYWREPHLVVTNNSRDISITYRWCRDCIDLTVCIEYNKEVVYTLSSLTVISESLIESGVFTEDKLLPIWNKFVTTCPL